MDSLLTFRWAVRTMRESMNPFIINIVISGNWTRTIFALFLIKRTDFDPQLIQLFPLLEAQ
jgi:hypothetical protein